MKRILVLLLLGFGAMTGAPLAARPQTPAPAAPPAQPEAQGGGRGGARAGGAAEPVSNDRTSVQIDKFLGDPTNSIGRLSHGGLLTRSSLRNGSPYVPGPAGAVLEYRTQAAKATLLPNSSTPLMSVNNQFLFYVVSGEGRLDDGRNGWELRNGITMLIPPDVQRRFRLEGPDKTCNSFSWLQGPRGVQFGLWWLPLPNGLAERGRLPVGRTRPPPIAC
jgi:mannose-6-phosphate isomerase-like protein (cupin superfamily)